MKVRMTYVHGYPADDGVVIQDRSEINVALTVQDEHQKWDVSIKLDKDDVRELLVKIKSLAVKRMNALNQHIAINGIPQPLMLTEVSETKENTDAPEDRDQCD